MDRYDVVYSQYFHGPGIGKKENGAYILHEDCKLRVEALSELLKNAKREAEEFRVKCVELERENAELKEENKKLSTIINNARHTINNMRKADADAIREMVKKVKHISLLGGFVALRLDHILEYADKLKNK